MRIVYYPIHFDGAGCYRCIYPGTQLRARGGHDIGVCDHEVLYADEKQSAIQFNLDTRVESDLVVIQQPGSIEYAQFQKAVQDRGIKVVIDMDDDHFNLPKYNPARKAVDSFKVLLHCVRRADAVTVTTPALRDSVSTLTSAPVYVLRNFLDWRVWEETQPVYESRTWDKLRIGYMGMSRWHGGDLEVLKPWLGEWVADHPDVEFVSVGDPKTHEILGIPKDQRVTVDSFSFRLQKIARYLANMDIGLVPLVRNKFNEAKSHLKGMEYAGVGVPCLASPTESYRDWWLAGHDETEDAGGRGTGFLCDRAEAWIRALDRLHSDEKLRLRLGANARQVASENTYQRHWRLWENVYNEVLS